MPPYTILAIVLIVLAVIFIVLMIQSHMKIKHLEKENPLIDNKMLHSFVYTKPNQENTGVVYNVFGMINHVNVSSGLYELRVVDGSGTSKEMLNKYRHAGGFVVIMRQIFSITYDRDIVTPDNETHNKYDLTRVFGSASSAVIADAKMTRIHVLSF